MSGLEFSERCLVPSWFGHMHVNGLYVLELFIISFPWVQSKDLC